MTMKQISFFFIFCLLFNSCAKEKKAEDIVIDEVLTHCDCVNSFYLVVSELNTLNENESNLDSHTYLKTKNKLEKIMNAIDQKCIVFEGDDIELKICDNYQNLLLEMDLYGVK